MARRDFWFGERVEVGHLHFHPTQICDYFLVLFSNIQLTKALSRWIPINKTTAWSKKERKKKFGSLFFCFPRPCPMAHSVVGIVFPSDWSIWESVHSNNWFWTDSASCLPAMSWWSKTCEGIRLVKKYILGSNNKIKITCLHVSPRLVESQVMNFYATVSERWKGA